MDGTEEVITGCERRRRSSVEVKLRIMAETVEPSAQVRTVAVRHGVCESFVFT